MGTSIGQAIDYLFAGVNTQTNTDVTGLTLLQALKQVDATAIIADSIPTATSQSLVVIGRDSPEDAQAASGSRVVVQMGANKRQETYDIPCWVECSRPGPAAKPARDAAIALFDVIAHWVDADNKFGTVLLQGRAAELSDMTLTLDEPDDQPNGSKRTARITFVITCNNHYAA